MKDQITPRFNVRQIETKSKMYNSVSSLSFVLFTFLTLLFSTRTQAQNSLARQAAIELVREGDNHLRLGGWQQAIISYSKAIETDPDYAVAYMKRGQVNERILRTREATHDYNMAIYLNPQIDIFYSQRARIKVLSYDYFGAVEDMTAAIKINPVESNYVKHQVDALIALGLYKDALQQLDSLNVDEANDLYPFQRKSLVFLLNGDIASAKAEIEKAYEIDKTNYLTLDLLGLIELKRNNYTDAIEWFDLAIAEDSSQFTSFYNRGICRRFLGQTELALQDINTSLRLNNNQQKAFFNRALIKKEKGDLSGSIHDYSAAIALDSSYEEAIYNRSFSFKILGDFATAEEDINFLLDSNDDKPEYWNMKGNLQVLHGDLDSAIISYRTAISLDVDYPDAYYNIGVTFLLLNQTQLACEFLQKSLNMDYLRGKDLILNFCGY